MRSRRSLVLPVALAAALCGARLAGAQRAAPDARAAALVSTAWLAERLTDSALVLLHVGERAEYDARHIPGARHVPLHDVAVDADGLTLEMRAPDVLRARLAALGISDGSRIVVYYGNDWIAPATRVVFALDHAGLGAATSLLDGGMRAWVRDGGATTAAVPPARVGTLSPLRVRSLVVDAAFVHERLGRPGVSIVDARSTAFYNGVQTGGMRERPHRTGHITGARSVPATGVVDERLAIRPPAELAALFARAGVQPGDTIVAYCHIGQQATAVLFAARTLGHPVLLYDGSFEDWSRRTELPVTNARRRP